LQEIGGSRISVTVERSPQQNVEEIFIQHAVDLLSQQIWCWGRDILRPEGNWLLQMGFQRIEPPTDERKTSSVYCLEIPNDRCVILRGYGVFYGDSKLGGVFLPRYEYVPKYTEHSTLKTPPWKSSDLPELKPPTKAQKTEYRTLVLDLIDWIRNYEQDIIDKLGVEYRRYSLEGWDNGKRTIIPVEDMSHEWEQIGMNHFDAIQSP
tara:strand:+ start:559 stop:1179 length:621 start_codon:yes stop_codon:yes gene_type:complete